MRFGFDLIDNLLNDAVFSTIVLTYFFLGESMSVYQIIGTCFVIAGVIMIGRKGGGKSRKRDTA